MKLFYLDLGAATGWACHAQDGSISYGQWDLNDGNKTLPRAHRLFNLSRLLDGALRGWMGDCVVYERPFCRGMAATRSLWGYAGVIEAIATGRGFPVVDAENKSVKKFASGLGGATKADMISAAKILLGNDRLPLTEHMADAICGLHYALQFTEHTSK